MADIKVDMRPNQGDPQGNATHPINYAHSPETVNPHQHFGEHQIHIEGLDFSGSFARSDRAAAIPINATLWYLQREYFTDGWLNKYIWKAAYIEGVGTFCLTYLSGQFGVTIANYGTVQVGAYVGIWCAVMLSTAIYATAAQSGGHMNPLITFSTIICGLTPVPRGVIYIGSQIAGASVAGAFLLASWGYEKTASYHGGGCFFDPAHITAQQVLVTEICCCFILMFLAVGIGLDPRQAKVFGPHLGPALVGLVLGMVSFVTTGTAAGYTGASLNPARCFGYAVASGEWSNQWIWWVGMIVGSTMLALVYNIAPPQSAKEHMEDE